MLKKIQPDPVYRFRENKKSTNCINFVVQTCCATAEEYNCPAKCKTFYAIVTGKLDHHPNQPHSISTFTISPITTSYLDGMKIES
jgi:hypothetical protein